MSLSGDSRAEFCPEGIDLFSQLGDASGVVHDHVSRTSAIFSTGLSGNSDSASARVNPLRSMSPWI